MNRLYVLINVHPGKAEQVVRVLQNRTGVLFADILASPPDIIMVVQASDCKKLALHTLDALTPVENMIKELQLLPAIDKKFTNTSSFGFYRN